MLQPAGRHGPLWILLKIVPPPTQFLPSPAVSSFPFPASHTWRRERQAEDFVTNCYGFCDVKRRAQSFKFGPTSSHYKVKQCKEVKSEGIIRGVLSACCWCLLPPPICPLVSVCFFLSKEEILAYISGFFGLHLLSFRMSPTSSIQTRLRREWREACEHQESDLHGHWLSHFLISIFWKKTYRELLTIRISSLKYTVKLPGLGNRVIGVVEDQE